MDPREQSQALQICLNRAKRSLEAGDREGALEALESALTIDAEFLAPQALRDDLVGAGGPTGPAPTPPRIAAPDGWAWIEQRARQKRTEHLLAAARAALRDGDLHKANVALGEVKDLAPDHADLASLTQELADVSSGLFRASPVDVQPPAEEARDPAPDPPDIVWVTRVPAVASSSPSEARIAEVTIEAGESGELPLNGPDISSPSWRRAPLSYDNCEPKRRGRWLVAVAAFGFVLIGTSWLERVDPPASDVGDIRLTTDSRAVETVQPASVTEDPPEVAPPVTTAAESAGIPFREEPSPAAGTAGIGIPETRPREPLQTAASVRPAVAPTDREELSPAAGTAGIGIPETRPREPLQTAASVRPALAQPEPADRAPVAVTSPVAATATLPAPTGTAPVATALENSSVAPIGNASNVPAPVAPAEAPPRASDSGAAVPSRDDSGAAVPSRDQEDRQIRQVLDRYRVAYEKLDARSARQVWPGVNEEALARAFDGLLSQSVTFDACDIRIRGSNATAACSGTARYVPKVGSRFQRVESRSWDFTLRKTGADWKIEAARADR